MSSRKLLPFFLKEEDIIIGLCAVEGSRRQADARCVGGTIVRDNSSASELRETGWDPLGRSLLGQWSPGVGAMHTLSPV